MNDFIRFPKEYVVIFAFVGMIIGVLGFAFYHGEKESRKYEQGCHDNGGRLVTIHRNLICVDVDWKIIYVE